MHSNVCLCRLLPGALVLFHTSHQTLNLLKTRSSYLCVCVFALRIVREEFSAFTRPGEASSPAGDNPTRRAESRHVM